MVSDIPAGAVSGEGHSPEIGMILQPRLAVVGLRSGDHPLKGGPAILVCDGEGVFGGKTVLDGDGDDIGLGDEGIEVVLVGRGEGGFDAEGSTMEVDEEGQLRRGGGYRFGGEVEPGGDAGGGGDGDVFGVDAGVRVEGRRDGGCAGEPLNAAVLVDSNERREIVSYLTAA